MPNKTKQKSKTIVQKILEVLLDLVFKMQKVDQGIVIIIDIGQNVSTSDEKNSKTFFAEARECAAKIIERKIMSQGKNHLGIILLGSKKSKNSLAEQCAGGFRKIELLHELQAPNWQMIRSLPEEATNTYGDWIDAIIAAVDHFKNGVSGVKYVQKKIVLMTNFLRPTKMDADDVDQVLNGLVEDHFEVDIIGPNIFNEGQDSKDLELARQFIQKTNGATEPFDHTMEYLQFHKKRIVNPTPWNVDLSFGPNVKIPVSAYIRLKDEPVIKKWNKAVKDRVTSTASTVEGIKKSTVHVNTENQTVVERDNVIKGYPYGQKVIPFGECDKTMLYDPGEKCLSVYGFTHATNITWQNLSGDGLHYVFGKKGNKKAQDAITCLVQCLHELNLVGIVRRVYSKGNAPKMFALMPVIDNNDFICLSMAEICFKEEIKQMKFPSTNLKKFSCTDEQVNAFKDLIHAMDLTKAYDDSFDDAEAFPIAETVSPSVQYMLDCIAFRAMNPGKPLPQPRDEIMMLFKLPPLIEKRSRDPLVKLKKLLILKEVEKKTRNKKNDDAKIDNTPMKPFDEPPSTSTTDIANGVTKIQMPKKTVDIVRIGTVNPIQDYKALVEKDKKLSDLAPEMSEAIESLVFYNIDGNYTKALDAMTFFREECVKAEPSHYNNWLQKFKTALNNRNKPEMIGHISEKNLGAILRAENELSNYDAEDTHDDSQAYENDTIPNSAELTLASTMNDMFDEM